MTGETRKRPTIDDVASASGVSRGTVSRVLNGGHWVSPEARQAVERAIRQTGYRINPHARNLATARANSIAFLLTESQDRLFEDPNFSALMRGAADSLAERDLPLVLLMAGSPDDQRRVTEFITSGHVDGALIVSSHRGRETFLKTLVQAKVPLVACGVPLGFERQIGYVAADEVNGARDVVAYLRKTGRSRIATIAGPQDTSGGIGRLEGYRDELGDAFDEQLVVEGDYSRDSGAAAMDRLLARAPDIDAVFVANDMMAAGAIEVLNGRGMRVPDDVAVAGFDDAPVASRTSPPLTTMRQPFEWIAREMVRMLLDVIDGNPAGRTMLPTELIIRESA
ncbi:MAG TPA: LacI family DNA-binding transcriptional regulator [Microbacterium sp.]|uniref:LacI family DNA-binding transcriptional regulator n=1 Tax=Microbacterium sp. TaxID=51671 RepID=UPI002BA5CCBC|nr:LacI family DNA-binding transcriptional regulator [Microbacterium sp.]HWI29895.1 LacI family DNA-binding transcriptional regulator [Microbacterium sp.]